MIRNRGLRGQGNLKLKETINLQKLTALQKKMRYLLYTVILFYKALFKFTGKQMKLISFSAF